MKRGELKDDLNFDKDKFNVNSIMVCGCIGLGYKSKLFL